MLRKIVVSVVLLALCSLSAPNTSQAQGNNFVGKWNLQVQLPGVPFAFNYQVVAEGAPANDSLGVPASTRQGIGTVAGLIDFCPGCIVRGLSWRHTPLNGSMPTGVGMSFESPSNSSPSTFILEGAFMTADRIEGRATAFGDPLANTNPNDIDSRFGRTVSVGTFVATRQP